MMNITKITNQGVDTDANAMVTGLINPEHEFYEGGYSNEYIGTNKQEV